MYYELNKDGRINVRGPHVILSNEMNPEECDSDFYFHTVIMHEFDNGYSSNEEVLEAANWCEENCNDEWLVGIGMSAFKDINDAFAFKLACM